MRSALAIAALSLAAMLTGCSPGVPFDDPTAEYTQRTMLVSTVGGDSQAVNTAMQTATPWPRYVNNTNIPADGARMAKAVQSYESGSSSSGSAQTSIYSGIGLGAGPNNGASTGMTASPPPPPPGQ